MTRFPACGWYGQILTNPDYLADYTDRFFTEVIPVDIDGDVPAQALSSTSELNMPAPPVATAGQQQAVQPQQQWDAFGDAMSHLLRMLGGCSR